MSVFAATLSLSPASGTFNKGCTFSLDVVLNAGTDRVEGTDVNYLTYDTSRFIATSVNTGSIFSDYPINNVDSTAGKIYISGVDTQNKPFQDQGTFATVNFTVKDTAPTGASQMNFLFTNPGDTTDSNVEIISNNNVVDVLSSVTNGNFTVGSGACNVQASPSPSASLKTGVGKGGPGATGSATIGGGVETLPPAGSGGMTAILGISGLVLVILGILGLVLL